MYQSVFERSEKKYLLSSRQYAAITEVLNAHTVPDRYADSMISNLYYDTPDFLLIRRSAQKPKYKEKLRLRCYCVPNDQSPAFIEVKKKFDGVVYKRRICQEYIGAVDFLSKADTCDGGQIMRELSYFLSLYPALSPRIAGFYHRLSYREEKSDLRITIDGDIVCRKTDLDLRLGAYGTPIIPPDMRLMEIKCAGAFPLWLCHALDQNQIYPTSFSKYGTAYKELILKQGV